LIVFKKNLAAKLAIIIEVYFCEYLLDSDQYESIDIRKLSRDVVRASLNRYIVSIEEVPEEMQIFDKYKWASAIELAVLELSPVVSFHLSERRNLNAKMAFFLGVNFLGALTSNNTLVFTNKRLPSRSLTRVGNEHHEIFSNLPFRQLSIWPFLSNAHWWKYYEGLRK